MMNSWRYIEEDAVSVAGGLATDEYLMEVFSASKTPGVALRLYTYKDYCALVGRFQNIRAELNLEACARENVALGRRLTGGGAIIMGQEQLGVCIAASAGAFAWETVRDLCALLAVPLVSALKTLGIEAHFRAKNDLEVNGKKIAGLGAHVNSQGAIQFHASLLVDLDIAQMLKVLQIPVQKYEDRQAIQSVEQRMTTVSRELGKKMTVAAMRDIIKAAYEDHFKAKLLEAPLTPAENIEIEKIATARYRDDGWTFQNSPQPDMTGMSLKKTAAGLLRTYVALKGETLKSVLITGDFLEDSGVLAEIEARLKWSPLDRLKIEKTTEAVFLNHPPPVGLSAEAVADAIWLAAQRAVAAKRLTYKGACYFPNP